MTLFNFDDLAQFSTVGMSPRTLITPFNGHLIIFSRLLYHLVASIFGPQYWVLRVLGVAVVLTMDTLFFALLLRRLEPPLAVAAVIPVLFLGSAWEAILWPSGQLTEVLSIAAGLGAILALDNEGPRRDIVACVFLIVSLASFSVGACFAVGVAVSVLVRSDRWRRAWIFVVPLALWGAWLLWARHFHQSSVTAANVPHLPTYYWRSLEAVAASVTGRVGLGVPGVNYQTPPPRNLSGSWMLALLSVSSIAFLAFRRRSSIQQTLCPILATLVTYWTLTGLATGPGRGPEASRYMLPGVLLLLLVVAELARGVRIGRLALQALYSGVIVTAILNVLIFRQAHQFVIAYANNERAQLAMLELAGPHARPDFIPGSSTPTDSSPYLLITAADYLRGARHYGSDADTIAQVEASTAGIRERADAVLVAALGLTPHVTTHATVRAAQCTVAADGRRSVPTAVSVPRGGAMVRTNRGSFLLLGRFGPVPTVGVTLVAPGRWVELAIPVDRLTRRWMMAAPQAGRIEVCPLAK